MKVSRWEGCYDSSWKGAITNASFAHPAKMSRGLLERIIKHGFEMGYWQRGDRIGDCFGGVGTTGIVCAYNGLEAVLCELEPKFIGFANDNFALHRRHWEHMGLPLPRIVQEDSREFDEAVSGIVSSPPYADSVNKKENGIDWTKAERPERWGKQKTRNGCQAANGQAMDYGDTTGQIGSLKSGEVEAVISSPPFAQGYQGGGGINKNGYTARPDLGTDWVGKRTYQGQGGDRTAGNIETLKEGTVAGVISSPPYSDIAAGAGGLNTKPAKHPGQQSGRKAESASQDTDQKYGKSDGQISQLKGGTVDACISSPPYAETLSHGGGPDTKQDLLQGGKSLLGIKEGYGTSAGQISQLKGGSVDGVVSSPPFEDKNQCADPKYRENRKTAGGPLHHEYGDSQGQIGKEAGETYWQAVDAVYRACFRCIRPGGTIVLVVKDYCSKGRRVRLCDDTMRLLEHIGFVPLERIHAMLVTETVENGLFGDERTKRQRKSFFRRLYEAKLPEGDDRRIDHEEVLIARRPCTLSHALFGTSPRGNVSQPDGKPKNLPQFRSDPDPVLIATHQTMSAKWQREGKY